MNAQVWLISGLLLALVGGGVTGKVAWDERKELAKLRQESVALKTSNAELSLDVARLQDELKNGQQRVGELQRERNSLQEEKDEVARARKKLEDDMRKALQSKDITISELQGKLTVNILDRVLFDSGRTELKPEGQAVLAKIAKIMADYPDRQILVVGHTDNVPIRATSRSKFPTNWELSVARASAAVRYLSEKAGVAPRRLGAAGYGEYRPIADNKTPEGRARNRRIAVVIMAEELLRTEDLPSTAPAPEPKGGPTPTEARPATAPSPPAPAPVPPKKP